MTGKSAGLELLEKAYRVESPEDNIRFYAEMAAHYDADFTDGLGWIMPAALARVYLDASGPEDAPVADIGCGTGAVAEALRGAGRAVEGFDISPEMLERAAAKGLYRALHRVDLTGDLSGMAGVYGAVLSSGAFTYGHLGPEVLRALLTIAKPGALFAICVNAGWFADQGFGPALEAMQAAGEIGPPELREVKMYARADHDHSGDVATVLVFRKA